MAPGLPKIQPEVFFGPSPERDALCERLGIEPGMFKGLFREQQSLPAQSPVLGMLSALGGVKPDIDASLLQLLSEQSLVWAEIGRRLAAEQPEFGGGKRGRGRPKKGEAGRDYDRYRVLRNRVRDQGGKLGETILYKDAIEKAKDDNVPLFSTALEGLIASVSRGNRIWKEADRRSRQMWADGLRKDCELLRMRKRWLQEVEAVAARLEELNQTPPKGLLDPGFAELSQIRDKLVNPFRRGVW